MKSINKQIIASILITVLIIFGGGGFLEIKNIIIFEKERLKNIQSNTINRLAYNLGSPLWNLNLTNIEKIIQYESNDKNIRAILVYDENSELYAGYIVDKSNKMPIKFDVGNPVHRQLEIDKFRFIHRDIEYQNTIIGKVVLCENDEPLKSLIWNLKKNLFYKLCVLMLSISIVQFLILNKVVIKPLKLLTNWASSLYPESITNPPNLSHSMEIETLTNVFMNNTKKLAKEINERKIIEQNIAKLNLELEQKVLQRTAQLEASNKELEAFSYSVSHDLRAPLRHINGFTELIVLKFNEQLPEKAKQYLKNINVASEQMGKLIDDLLHFSRINKVEPQTSLVDMNKLVSETVNFLKQETPNRNINWQVEELPDIYGESSMLKQVWANLLSNAVKYTGTRDVANISIKAKKEENNITYYVEDNGVGFDMKYCDKLFGVFQRLHSIEEFEGTGIGLANVRRIILKHKGQISANAEIDKGATFYFSLPINKDYLYEKS